MNCKEVEERDIIEGYLLDRLTELERDEFEKHYFECSSCFSQLQTGLAVQAELRNHPPTAHARGASFRRMWAWTPAFATAAVLLTAGIWWYSAQRHLPLPQVASSPTKVSPEVSVSPSLPALPLDELARVEPPPYSAAVLRGAEDEGQEAFRKAMQYYVKGNYAQAIPGVRAAVKASPQAASFRFYLGACYLLTGQTDPAIVSFHDTVSLGDSAYSEAAHFYLAKAFLGKKEISTAEVELQKTVQFHGGLEAEAGEILRQLRK